jgi:hypothetical protein
MGRMKLRFSIPDIVNKISVPKEVKPEPPVLSLIVEQETGDIRIDCISGLVNMQVMDGAGTIREIPFSAGSEFRINFTLDQD